MHPDDTDEMSRLKAEVAALEAALRHKKEQLIPKDRYDALHKLLLAETSAMLHQVTAQFEDALVSAKSAEEAQDVSDRMSAAIDAGLARVKATMLEQSRAWTIAALEDRARDADLV